MRIPLITRIDPSRRENIGAQSRWDWRMYDVLGTIRAIGVIRVIRFLVVPLP